MRNNRQYNYVYEEHIQSLRDVNEYFWLSLTNTDKTKNNLMVRFQKNGAQILEDHSKYQEILTNLPNSGQKSLVMVFDGTGSMFDDLAQMIEAAELITNEFTEMDDNPIFNYIFVPFRDPYIGPKLVTQDVNKFLEEIRQLYLFGGGDCPESSIGAINLALESALPKSDIFIFTDATAKDYGLDKDTIELIQKQQATLTFLLTGHCKAKNSEGYRVYEKLASLSNGEVYNLKKIDIRDVLLGIRSNLQNNIIPLQYLHSKEPGQHKFDVSVDSNLKQFTVSVAGENPTIDVLDPQSEKYEDVEEILNLQQLKILNVPNPQPGNWNVKTESDSEHSVKFTGQSDLNFNFGFTTTNNEDTVQNTNIHPVLLQNNILKITPSENELIHNLTSVELELISNDDEIISSDLDIQPTKIYLPLNKLEPDSISGSIIFGTKEFEPPRSMFKIYVNGFDANGNPLRHLLSTAIKAVKGEAPRIVNFDNYVQVQEGDSTILECKVLTISPVAIVWLRNNQQVPSIDATVQYFDSYYTSRLKLEALKVQDSGPYVCMTENENGIDTKFIQIVVKKLEVPLTVHMTQDYIHGLNEGDVNYQLSCMGSPNPDLNFKWYFNGEPIRNDNIEIDGGNLLLKYVDRTMSGNYTCIASDDKMNAMDSALIEIKFGPEILKPFEEEISIYYGEDYKFDCEAIGNPKPEIIWSKQENRNENFENGIIHEFGPHNEGTYKCDAFNNIGPSQKKIFKIKGKASGSPKIEKIVKEIDLDINETLNLSCKCDLCEPILYSVWTREISTKNYLPEILPTSESIYTFAIGQKHYKIFNSNITFDEMTRYDEGIYTCRLDNEHGSDSWTIYVKVLEPPKIVNIISNSTKLNSKTFETIESETYQFECEVEGNPKPEIKWFKYNQYTDEKDEIIESNEILKIFDIDSTHMGEYTCIANNSKGYDYKEFSINVLVPPKLKSTEETVIMIEDGKEVVLECNVEGNPFPTISWKYNDQKLQMNDMEQKNIDDIFLRFIAKLDDSGVYECEGTNKIGTIRKSIILIVFAAPKIIPPIKEIITSKVGDNVSLLCNYTGYPMPDIKWKFNHSPLESDFIEIMNSEEQTYANNELLLRNVTHSMEGIYLCEIENQHGVARKSYFLNVNYSPKITSNFQSYYKLKPNEKFELTCSSDGQPRPEINWKKSTSITSNFGSFLSLNNTMKSISGIYSCIATNSVGTDIKTIEIIALVKPKYMRRTIENTIPNITAESGRDIELYCPIEYADTFIWFKDEIMLNNNNQYTIKPFLLLKNASYKDSGNYICSGINEVGTQNYTQKLFINSPPIIQATLVSNSTENIIDLDRIEIIAHRGDRKTLKCLSKGYPQPKVQWRKDKAILSNDLELHLIDINVAHSGEYICEAKNQYGTDQLIFNVRVLVPPSSEQPKRNWIEFNQGDDLILQCEIYGNPWPNFHWEKNGLNMTGEFQEALIVHYSGLKDNGIYKCLAENELGKYEIEFIVNVMVPPKFKIDPIKNEVIFTTNDTIELECSVQGNPMPILTWTFNNKILVSTSKVSNINLKNDAKEEQTDYIFIDKFGNAFTYYDPNELFASQLWENQKNGLYGKVIRNNFETNLTLLINDEKMKKNGIYTCYAINAIGTDKYDTKVNIYSKPTLKSVKPNDDDKMELVTILKGLPLILSCPWNSNPPPHITWLMNNLSITPGHLNELSLSHNNQTLTIYNAHETDSGTCICIGRNILGEDQKAFNIEVLSPPQLQTENSVENTDDLKLTKLKLIRGQNTVLKCPVIGNPIPKIFWLKDDDSYNISNNESDIYHSIFPESTTELVINDLQESGLYSCYANNSLGFIEKKFTVEILKYPQIVSDEPNEINVTEFDQVKIHCQVDGNPKPDIFWYKDGIIINFRDDKTLYLDSDEEILKIPTAHLKHSGQYACVAKNELGEKVKYVDLNVKASAIWSPWSSWIQCNVTCGSGTKYRKRRCTRLNGESALDFKSCIGNDYESKSCEMPPCPIDGYWSDWSLWEDCPRDCWNETESKPIRKRYRFCNNPLPKYGGRACHGEDTQEKECNLNPCPIDGRWSNWFAWTSCSVSCGTGTKERSRLCNSPKPSNGGKYCKGLDKMVQTCVSNPCPINGGWSDWSSWSECSQTCGTGLRKRSRQCNNPTPEYDGKLCDGSNIEIAKCKKRQCNNSDLLKNFATHKRAKYVFNNIYEAPPNLYTEEYDSDTSEENYNEYAFATGSDQIITRESDDIPQEINDNGIENKTSSAGRKIKVILEVKSFKSLDKNLKEISFYPGEAPFVIQRINPCSLGQELGNNNECIDIDECKMENVCKENEICTNLAGGFDCSCQSGFDMNETTGNCQDINECLNNLSHNCSHICNNTLGNYLCSCPKGFELELNNRTCKSISQSLEDDGKEFMADYANTTPRYFYSMNSPPGVHNHGCPDGFLDNNGICEDVNECEVFESDCNENYSCLNTIGSYKCIETLCPPEYKRTDIIGQCILMCNESQSCTNDAKIAEIISHTLLSMKEIPKKEPFLKIVNYGINRRALPYTTFVIDETNSDEELFELETFGMERGIAYLYSKEKLKHKKLYRLVVEAESYNENNYELNYVTKFIIFLYLM